MPAKRPVDETDVRHAMTDLTERVRWHQQAMGLPRSTPSARDDVRTVADHWHVSAHLPLPAGGSILNRAVVLTQRLIRRLTRFYINPIIDQQNDFNAAVARAFVQIAAQQEALAKVVSGLEERVRALDSLDPPSEEPEEEGQ